MKAIAHFFGKEDELESFLKKKKESRSEDETDEQDAPQWLKELWIPLHGLYQAGFEDGIKLAKLTPDPSHLTDRFVDYMEHMKEDPIFKEFEMSSSDSEVFIKREYSAPPALQEDRGFDILCQRGRSIDIPMKMVYVKQGRIQGRFGDSPEDVSVRVVAMQNMAHRKAARELTDKELQKRAQKHLQEKGTYDRDLFYDTSQLVSFSDVEDPMYLHDREIKHFKVTITIPSNFPDDMLNQSLMVIIEAEVDPDIVGSQSEYIRLLVPSY